MLLLIVTLWTCACSALTSPRSKPPSSDLTKLTDAELLALAFSRYVHSENSQKPASSISDVTKTLGETGANPGTERVSVPASSPDYSDGKRPLFAPNSSNKRSRGDSGGEKGNPGFDDPRADKENRSRLSDESVGEQAKKMIEELDDMFNLVLEEEKNSYKARAAFYFYLLMFIVTMTCLSRPWTPRTPHLSPYRTSRATETRNEQTTQSRSA